MHIFGEGGTDENFQGKNLINTAAKMIAETSEIEFETVLIHYYSLQPEVWGAPQNFWSFRFPNN